MDCIVWGVLYFNLPFVAWLDSPTHLYGFHYTVLPILFSIVRCFSFSSSIFCNWTVRFLGIKNPVNWEIRIFYIFSLVFIRFLLQNLTRPRCWHSVWNNWHTNQTIKMDMRVVLAILGVFVGCCVNVVILEYMVKWVTLWTLYGCKLQLKHFEKLFLFSIFHRHHTEWILVPAIWSHLDNLYSSHWRDWFLHQNSAPNHYGSHS